MSPAFERRRYLQAGAVTMSPIDGVLIIILPVGDLLNWIYFKAGRALQAPVNVPTFGPHFFARYWPILFASLLISVTYYSSVPLFLSDDINSVIVTLTFICNILTLIYILLFRPRLIIAKYQSDSNGNM